MFPSGSYSSSDARGALRRQYGSAWVVKFEKVGIEFGTMRRHSLKAAYVVGRRDQSLSIFADGIVWRHQ